MRSSIESKSIEKARQTEWTQLILENPASYPKGNGGKNITPYILAGIRKNSSDLFSGTQLIASGNFERSENIEMECFVIPVIITIKKVTNEDRVGLTKTRQNLHRKSPYPFNRNFLIKNPQKWPRTTPIQIVSQ